MFFLVNSQSNSTSRDAMTVAPYSCTAKNENSIEFFSGIALAMSVLLCLFLSSINAIIIITGIIILSIRIILCIRNYKEKAVKNLA